jgi:hypothetical protein
LSDAFARGSRARVQASAGEPGTEIAQPPKDAGAGLRHALLHGMDIAGGLEVPQQTRRGGRQFVREARKIQAAAGIVAGGLSKGTAMRQQVQVDAWLADGACATGGAHAIDHRAAADQRDEGIPVGALRIELRLALQQVQQEVLAEILLVGLAEGQSAGAGPRVAAGDAEG